ncbi:alcohol dehydrogenase class IV [Stackebrandtia endophytica]|uniref:Alcohol dehydrogenase class IV n=1 Tax=Stackebrandtia endophytica TaxID=1496996 RepID=A0A543AZN5_9ACTN|nr:phosphonoacetaldehyde reductase [Stackebrandtia endophytica]TQL78044.1 alcohol dehydrogenase class IV [Stackebrandtia endophytica]
MLPADRNIRFSDHAILETAQLAEELGVARVLLVCGKHAFVASGAAECLPELVRVAAVRRWSDFRANTDVVDLIDGLRLVEEFQPDLILGVGGGSAMDMAKLLCAYQGITDEDRLHEAIRDGAPVTDRRLKLVLSPTTSGSGSEATHFAVVYIGDQKYSIAGPAMLPDIVVLDPALTTSATPYQRATSGIDAVAQAVESLWSVGGTEASRGFAQQALAELIPALPDFVKTGSAESARQMALGSHLAGRAIDVSKTTAAHALSYGITKTYGLPHGHAVALTLGGFIAAHADATDDRLQTAISPQQHRDAMAKILAAWGADSAREARDGFHKLAEGIGLSMDLVQAGVTTRQQVAELVSKVNLERLGNNPVRFTREQLEDLVFRS